MSEAARFRLRSTTSQESLDVAVDPGSLDHKALEEMASSGCAVPVTLRVGEQTHWFSSAKVERLPDTR